MVDPISIGGLALLSTGISAAGAGVGAFGAMYSGQAQANQYTYQAGMARVNQQIEAQNAEYARSVGEVQAQESGMKSRYRVGEITSAQAASNLDITKGTAPLVRESQTEIAEHDQALIRSNAAKRAYGFEVEGMKEGAAATMYGQAAETTKTAAAIKATSSILGGVSSVSSKWLQGSSAFGGGDASFLPSSAFMENRWGY